MLQDEKEFMPVRRAKESENDRSFSDTRSGVVLVIAEKERIP